MLLSPQSVVESPTDAIFNLAGITGLPTIAPVLNEVFTVSTFTLNSLYIAPLVSGSMNVTFTPFRSGVQHYLIPRLTPSDDFLCIDS